MSPIILAYLRKYWKNLALVGLVVAALTYANNQSGRLERETIRANNAEAGLDSLKVKYRNDSIVVVGILGLTRTELIGLRKQLKLAGKTKTYVEATITPGPVLAEHEGAPAAPDSLGAFTVEDSVIGPAVHVRAAATITPRVDSSLGVAWSWAIRPQPIPIAVDVGCLDRLKPEVLVKGPPWAKVDRVEATAAPEVCGGGNARDPWLVGSAAALYGTDGKFSVQLEAQTRALVLGLRGLAQFETLDRQARAGLSKEFTIAR